MLWKMAGLLGAAVLITACDRSPVAPSMRAIADNHVEPPGVLLTRRPDGRNPIASTPVTGTER